MKPVYLIASSCISPQDSFGREDLFNELISTDDNVLYCKEPNYSQYINPVQIRRMSRALKMGFTAALDCLAKSPSLHIDGIIVGTGKGCMTDTEQFLHSIKDFHETALNPTHFIHSTYNQINGMVALNKKINSYNITYVHRGFSFEHALLDAMMLLEDKEAKNVLVGSFDEMTKEHFEVKLHWGYWKKESINSLELLGSDTPGTIAGEGSSFFILSQDPPATPAPAILDLQTLYKPSLDVLQYEVNRMLHNHQLQQEDIDFLLLGEDGDQRRSKPYELLRAQFPNTPILCFKHLCGEYDTASNFGFWICEQILLRQTVPDFLFHPSGQHQQKGAIKRILFYNNYFEQNQSLILMGVV